MKKIKISLIISFVLCFSGCIIHKKDVTQMVFPMTVLLSKQNNKFQIYLLVLSNSISSIIEMESSQHDTLYTTIMFEGDTISEASAKSAVMTDGNVSTIKIRSIILHDSLFSESTINYKDLTSYIINNPLFRTNIYVYYTKDEPKEILNINSLNFSTNTYFYLSRPDQKHLNDFLLPSQLLNTSKSYIDNGRMFYLPSITMSKDNLMQESEGKLEPVNIYQLDGGYFLTRTGEFKFIKMEDLEGLKWKNKRSYFDIDLGDENFLLNIKVEESKWKTSIKNGQIYVDVKVVSKINYNHTDLSFKEIETRLHDYIHNEITSTYYNTYKDIDIYHFDDLAYRLNKKIESNNTFNLNIEAIVKNTIYEY